MIIKRLRRQTTGAPITNNNNNNNNNNTPNNSSSNNNSTPAVPFYNKRNNLRPIQLTTEHYMTNINIHNNLPDLDDNLISYYQQNVGALELQYGSINVDDFFQLIVDHELSLLDASDINSDTIEYYVLERIYNTN